MSASPAPGGAGFSAAKAKALMKDAWRVTKQVALQKSRIELVCTEATGDEKWGPTGAQMTEISEAAFDAEKFRQAWSVILKRFESEPAQWRRVYKALLLTEHLLKNSSQHVVQTILDAAPIFEGLKQFRYMDEKNKDHGINVSNRAKELVLLLENPDRIRAERQKAKSLKEKFKGASREQMAAAAGGGGAAAAAAAPGWGSTGGSQGYHAPAGGLERHSAGGHARARGGDDEGHLGEEGPALSGAARPKGYGAVPSHIPDPVAATAQRISGMRRAGLLRDEEGPGVGLARPSSESSLGGLGAGGAGAGAAMHSSASQDDLSGAHSGGSQPAKPSLQELAARRAGPKKLQEVRVNPAIASSLAALSGKPAAAPTPTPVPANKPAAVALAPPPAAKPEPAAALAELLAPAAEPHSAPRTASGASSGGASPAWAAASPQHGAPRPAGWDAFQGAGSGHSTSPASPTAAAAVPALDAFAAAKPTASPGAISLTATAGPAPGGSAAAPALPAYLFAEPTPPGYTAAFSWGSHVAGASAAVPPPASPTARKGAALAKAPSRPEDALFADFSPFN